MRALLSFVCLATCLVSIIGSGPAHAASFAMQSIGSVANRAGDTGFGAVDYHYKIGTFEVTNAQYSEFLNSVAAADPNGLYNSGMGSNSYGGIDRLGNAGSYIYAVDVGTASLPVGYVSYFDSLRFVNWLENGQPIGSQDATTTEDGSYTFFRSNSAGGRHEDASIFLPSEDEWYKAAYYNPHTASYSEYPTDSDAAPTCESPTGGVNSANCRFAVRRPTDVGSYAASQSAFGTFDQGGNVSEWNESWIDQERGLRGGAWLESTDSEALAAALRGSANPSLGSVSQGFRIAMIPEPGTALLLMSGLVMLAFKSRA